MQERRISSGRIPRRIINNRRTRNIGLVIILRHDVMPEHVRLFKVQNHL